VHRRWVSSQRRCASVYGPSHFAAKQQSGCFRGDAEIQGLRSLTSINRRFPNKDAPRCTPHNGFSSLIWRISARSSTSNSMAGRPPRARDHPRLKSSQLWVKSGHLHGNSATNATASQDLTSNCSLRPHRSQSNVRRSEPISIGSMWLITISAPQFGHLRLSISRSGLGINWD
jgi:hypothetical protein